MYWFWGLSDQFWSSTGEKELAPCLDSVWAQMDGQEEPIKILLNLVMDIEINNNLLVVKNINFEIEFFCKIMIFSIVLVVRYFRDTSRNWAEEMCPRVSC